MLFQYLNNYIKDPLNYIETLALIKYPGFEGSVLLKEAINESQKKFKVKCEIQFASVKIFGQQGKEAKRFITDCLDKLKSYKFPPTWEDTFKQVQPGGHSLILKDAVKGSNEWANIEQKFKVTMPSSNITQIQRIQNKNLWRTF
jgi:hypothetical protein